VILENGVVRTMEPSLPLARSLAIAGDRIVGGVGAHETSLPGPERIDLGGRCVVPGFNDSHVHFPTWAIAQHEVRLEGTTSLEEAVARVRDALPQASGTWLRGRGWRSGDWSPPVEPTKHELDAIAPDRPVALMARDSHSVWLNSAALARANGDLQVAGGVVELDERGEPTGVLREESCWQFRDRYIETSDDEYVEAMRSGMRLAASRGVTALHDKDGWLGALRFWQRLDADDALILRVWQSLPAEKAEELADVDVRSGLGSPLLRLGYLKAFMDGTLGSQTARMLDGSGVEITSREELEEHIRNGARAGFPIAVHAIGDLANREALDAFETTRSEWEPLGLRPRIEHAQLLASEDLRVSPSSASPRRCSSATRRPTATSPTASGAGSTASRTRSGRCSNRAPCSRTAPTRRSRSSTPCWESVQASAYPRRARGVAPRAGADRRAGAPRDHRSRRRGSRATNTAAESSCRGSSPTSVVLDRDPLDCEATSSPR
jgi:predicted amidohydrolase YtcJ